MRKMWNTAGSDTNNNYNYLNIFIPNFDVLLTVHLSVILVINQLNAQILVL